MARPHKRLDAPERPVTFHAAENLGAFDLAQLWADRAAWPIDERTAYDELAELATMSALATWLTRWLPIAIHGAMLAGAKPGAVAGALGSSVEVAYERWHDWAERQRAFIVNGKPGITEDEFEAIERRFAVEMSTAHAESPQLDHHSAGRRCEHSQCRRQRRSM